MTMRHPMPTKHICSQSGYIVRGPHKGKNMSGNSQKHKFITI